MSAPVFSFLATEDLSPGSVRVEKVQGVCESCQTKEGLPRVIARTRLVDILHAGSRRGREAIAETLQRLNKHDEQIHHGRGRTRINFELAEDYTAYRDLKR